MTVMIGVNVIKVNKEITMSEISRMALEKIFKKEGPCVPVKILSGGLSDSGWADYTYLVGWGHLIPEMTRKKKTIRFKFCKPEEVDAKIDEMVKSGT